MTSKTNAVVLHDHSPRETIFRLREELGNADSFQAVSELFKQVSDVTRLRVFWLLCHCEECVTDIAQILQMSSPAVSHHLRPLRDGGLIVSRRVGKEVYYRAADTSQSRLLHDMIEQVMEIACPNLGGK